MKILTFCVTYKVLTSLVAQMAKNLSAMQENQVRSLGQEDSHGNPLQSCLENTMDRGTW